MADDDDLKIRSSGQSVAVVGAIAGAVPFVMSSTTTSSETVNGGVTHFSYRDNVAIGGGGAALVLGVAAVVMAARARAKPVFVGAALVVALGGYQLARGFGVFAPKPASNDVVAMPSEPPPAPAPAHPAPAHPAPQAPPDPATCADENACDNLAAELDKTDPKAALVARTRACDLGEKYTCEEAAQAWADDHRGHDLGKALALYEKGCALGNEDACTDAGAAYINGEGAPKDLDRGRQLNEKACDLGGKIGCKNAAMIYRDGTGVAPDPAKTLAFAEKACEREGHVDASVAADLGAVCSVASDLLRHGKGVPHDPKRADVLDQAGFQWDHDACEHAPRQCFNYALDFEQGDGVAKDLAAARTIYGKTCDAGTTKACRNLAEMLAHGEGGPKDGAGATAALHKACDAGDDDACKRVKK